ncbi:MAG: hypothetical protein ACLT2T_11805 [Bilophila wadsworthia]
MSVSSPAVCHTVDGNKDGNPWLADAMHAKTSDSSCVAPSADRDAEGMCRKAVPSCLPIPVPPATRTKALPSARSPTVRLRSHEGTACRHRSQGSAAQPAPAKPFGRRRPETVTIGALSNDFEPSVFPHRKITKPL